MALKLIRNSLARGAKSPSIRDIQIGLGYKSPRSAALIVEKLIESRHVIRRPNGQLRLMNDLSESDQHARTVAVPLVGTVACGIPLLAEENIEAMIPVSTSLAKPGHRYFLLRAQGDSMNDAEINDGDLVLVRQQQTASDGDVVVALIDEEATVKEFRRSLGAIVLRPRSKSSRHQPIILRRDFRIQGVVVSTIPKLNF